MTTTTKFDKDTPPESISQDTQVLNRFDQEQFCQLTDIVFSLLIDPGKSDQFLSALEAFAQQHGVNVSALRNLVKTVMYLPTNAVKKSHTADLFLQELSNLGLDHDKGSYFISKWEANNSTLVALAMAKVLSVNQLVDLEWKFGVTAASSEMDRVGTTFLQLKLVISKGSSLENVWMELTLPQFYAFLHEMERAKASLEYFS